MAAQVAPTTTNELIQKIGTLVKERASETDRRVSGSWLAEALRREYPELDYGAIGLSRLADAVHLARVETGTQLV